MRLLRRVRSFRIACRSRRSGCRCIRCRRSRCRNRAFRSGTGRFRRCSCPNNNRSRSDKNHRETRSRNRRRNCRCSIRRRCCGCSTCPRDGRQARCPRCSRWRRCWSCPRSLQPRPCHHCSWLPRYRSNRLGAHCPRCSSSHQLRPPSRSLLRSRHLPERRPHRPRSKYHRDPPPVRRRHRSARLRPLRRTPSTRMARARAFPRPAEAASLKS